MFIDYLLAFSCEHLHNRQENPRNMIIKKIELPELFHNPLMHVLITHTDKSGWK